MKRLLILLSIITSAVWGMETSVKHADIEMPTTTDVVGLWGQLQCESFKTHKNAKKIFSLFHCVCTLASIDKFLLHEDQIKTWKDILINFKKFMFNEKQQANDVFLDDLDEYLYPENYFTARLKTIKWVKNNIKAIDSSVIWPKNLELTEDLFLRTQWPTFDNEIIVQNRLLYLRFKKNHFSKKLISARLAVQKPIEQLSASTLSEMFQFLQRSLMPMPITLSTINKSILITEVDEKVLKAATASFSVLLKLDFDWYAEEYRAIMNDMVIQLNKIVWKKDIRSRSFYRWQLQACNWAEEKIINDVCDDLKWMRFAFNKEEIAEMNIPCPSSEELKNKRLAAIALYRKEARDLLHNFEKRQALVFNQSNIKKDFSAKGCTVS